MGSSNYSDAIYTAKITSCTSRGVDPFAHTAAVHSGTVRAGVHEKLDPSKPNKSGKLIRESLDSDIHPTSRAVAVLFDVTGSMEDKPRLFAQEKLGKLMATLVKKGILEHPHVLFGGIGDAYCDAAPIQIGQFEGGNEMDDALLNIFLEGGGGGQATESYDLSLYYMSRHTVLDCFNKRGEKGYLFIIGDEDLYPAVNKDQVKRYIGDTLEADIPVEKIIEEVKDKFEVFWLRPSGTSNYGDKRIEKHLKQYFPERVIDLGEPGDVCEVIASLIGVTEGYDLGEVKNALIDSGADAEAIDRAGNSLVKYAATVSVAKATSTGALSKTGTDSVQRL